MKRIILAISILMVAFSAMAQDAETKSNNLVSLSVGGGLSNYCLDNSADALPTGSFSAEIGYVRMFSHGLGLGVGVKMMNVGSVASFSKSVLQQGLCDSEGEMYDLTTKYLSVKEKHGIWALAVPVSLQYRKMFTDRCGLTASAGVSALFPVSTKFKTLSGRIVAEAYYPEWNVTLHDIDGIYDSYDVDPVSRYETAYKKFGLAIDLQVGFVYAISQSLNATASVAYTQTVVGLLSDGPANSLLVNVLDKRKLLPYGVVLKLGVEYCF